MPDKEREARQSSNDLYYKICDQVVLHGKVILAKAILYTERSPESLSRENTISDEYKKKEQELLSQFPLETHLEVLKRIKSDQKGIEHDHKKGTISDSDYNATKGFLTDLLSEQNARVKKLQSKK